MESSKGPASGILILMDVVSREWPRKRESELEVLKINRDKS